jgi:hypothetical protein
MSNDTTVPADSKPKGKPAQVTEYMVCQQVPAGDGSAKTWRELGKAKALNANQAIAKMAGDEPDGTYVAVPVRSWRPVKPTVTVERRVSWS